MGVHYIMLLMITTHNPYIALQIMQFLNLRDMAKIVMFLPQAARVMIAETSNLITNMTKSYNDQLCVKRILHCLTHRNARKLYMELESLNPFMIIRKIAALPFTEQPLKLSSFSPKQSLLACFTANNIMSIFNYETMDILFYSHITEPIIKLGWNNIGTLLYLITGNINEHKLYVYLCLKGCRLILTLPIHSSMNSHKLWFTDYILLYKEPEQHQSHICGLHFTHQGSWCKGPITRTCIDRCPLTFSCLDIFKNLDMPICIAKYPHYIFFRTSCPYKNPLAREHHCLIALDVKKKTIALIYHCSGYIYNIECNHDLLVFCYKGRKTVDYIISCVLPPDLNNDCTMDDQQHLIDHTNNLFYLTLGIFNPREATVNLRRLNNG